MTTRERIIEAASAVFVRYGYRLTSMEAVAQEAGLTRQALYHHFPTKEALFRATVETIMDAVNDAAEAAGQAVGDGGSLADALAAQIIARYEFFIASLKSSPHAEELLSEHMRQTQDLHEAYVARSRALTVDTIGRFAARGVALARGTTAEDLARFLQIAEAGAKSAPAGVDTRTEIERITRLLVRGALASPDGGPQGRQKS